MNKPNVKTRIQADGYIFIISAYRPVTNQEALIVINEYIQIHNHKPKPGTVITIKTIIGFDDNR